jgi:arylsulfatase A-like enzyme/Flp pilus assembly protein TadD
MEMPTASPQPLPMPPRHRTAPASARTAVLAAAARLALTTTLVTALAAALALTAGCGNRNGRGDNLLLITLDTLRADHLGSYGYRAAITPNLDRLAKEGVRFAQASSAVPLTLPAHATLLTGLLPPHHGLRNNGAGTLPPGTETLATRLAGAGYRTAAFVGAFVLDRRFGLTPGFEVYDDEIERDPRAGVTLEAERPGREVVDRALAWLERDDPRPFFLWVHLYDAHAPYEPPPAWRDRHPGRPYDGEISEVDEQVGRLLAALQKSGRARRTVIAVVGDHGEGLGEHGEQTHGLLLYEPTLHVPLLLRAPGRLARRVIATPVSTVDLAPTLAGLLDRPLAAGGDGGGGGDSRGGATTGGRGAHPHPPRGIDGRDLSATLLGAGAPEPGEIYAETEYPALFGWSPLSSLRRRDRKYIASPGGELYDLGRDPRERTNLLRAAAGPPGEAKGFAARLSEIEKGAVGGARPAVDAETRSRLASLGYVAGAPGARSETGAAAAGSGLAPPRVDLFQRFEAAASRLDAGQTAVALGELEALVAADPANPVFRGKLAQAHRSNGDFDRAIALYRQAAEQAADDPEAWYNLAATLQDAGRPVDARAAVQRALKLDSRRPEAHNTLGIVYMAQGKAEAARGEFASATELDPRNAPAWNNLGNALRAQGRLDEAASAYQRSSAVAPRYAEPLNGLGTLEVDRNRPRAALSLFERALALAPESHEIRLNRAIAYDMAGDASAAVSAYRDFLAATAGDPRFAEQRKAATAFLARLLGPRGGPRGGSGTN